jgi:Amt family ammonium transporter
MTRWTALVPLLAGVFVFGASAFGPFAFGQGNGDPFDPTFPEGLSVPALPQERPDDPFARPPVADDRESDDREHVIQTLGASAPEPTPASTPVTAAEPPVTAGSFVLETEEFLLFLCAALVLLLQAGFAMLEAGFNSSKHTVNNLFKSVLNLAAGAIAFFLIGYHLMYPVEPAKENYVGQLAPGIDASLTTSGTPGAVTTASAGGLNGQTSFLFQAALAVTAATILSGAVAGRMRFGASLVYGTAVTAFVYPMIGYWTWGGGWLNDLGFFDLAGSGVVHMTGGFAGLAGAVLLGPRIGRYTADGRPIAIPGHSLPLATLGIFILLTGWYGLNAGGQLRGGSIDAAAVGLIAVNTTLSAAAGCCLATGLSWVLFGKPDLSMGLSGLLGGLVGISAACNGVTNLESLAIGGVSGGLVVLAIIVLDKLRVDDPVGAFPVHGVAGAWGLIACALFGDAAYWGGAAEGVAYGNAAAQLAGIVTIAGFSFLCMAGLFGMLKSAGFLRVTPDEEERGLDISEHGMSAYAA